MAATKQPRRKRLGEADVAALVIGAREGDAGCWEQLVEVFTPLIWSIVRAHGLRADDAADIAQVTWLRLVENLDNLTQPGRAAAWLATTTRRECLRVLRFGDRQVLVAGDDVVFDPAGDAVAEVDAGVLAGEERQALAVAFTRAPTRCRVLLRLLTSDPPLSYQEISEILEMPVGSIGPTRQRCLTCLRQLLERGSGDRAPAPAIAGVGTASTTS